MAKAKITKKNVKTKSEFSPGIICGFLSLVLIVGLGLALIFKNPLIAVIFLLPVSVYEVIRTQGDSTKSAAWLILGISIAEIILVVFNVNFDLASYLNKSSFSYQDMVIPLGEIKTIFPIVMAVASIVLIRNTMGVYTKWLAGLIILASAVVIYTISPEEFSKFFNLAITSIMERIN